MHYIKLPFLYSLLFTVLALPVQADDTDKLFVDKWLHLGPERYQNPVYHDVPGMDGETWSVRKLLESDLAEYGSWNPEEGKSVSWSGSRLLQWNAAGTEDNRLTVSGEYKEDHGVAWAAVYLSVDRWVSGTLTLESPYLLRAFLNGEEILSKTSYESGNDNEPGSAMHALTLNKGKHLLLVKMIRPGGDYDTDWTLRASFDAGKHTTATSTCITPDRYVMLRDLSNAPQPTGVSVNSDGELAAVHIRRADPPDGSSEMWIDILKTGDGQLYRRFSGGMSITGMQWVPDSGGRRFSYTINNSNGTDLWVVDLDTGEKNRILRDVEDFSGYSWSPGADFVIYRKTERHEPGKDGVMRYHGLQDRRPEYHNRTYLYQLNVPEGTTRRLTAGRLSTSLADIHPDGSRILFLRNHELYDERPYGKTEYVELDLQTMETDSLFTLVFGGAARFSPEGRRILISGGPASFGDLGINIPDTLTANDYDSQLYIFYRDNGKTTAITREFDPAVEQAAWDVTGRYIYLSVTEKSYRKFYRYDTRSEQYLSYETGPDVIGSFSLARNSPVAAFTGSGASDTPKVYTIDFTHRNPEARLLHNPGEEFYRHVQFGDIKSWTFTNEFGEEIDGHVYYPPDFDDSKSWPVIVNYYGGTVPTSRTFGGRYPKELYASNGYIVYVLQPSGATGYGQEFSARHVNDWGKIAGKEIIRGVESFLDAHDYADRDRVGAIGASYGGFMTMYLLTQTDLFAAAVSHAGISNLSSYWGEGFWGYQYSGVATAESFPWNRRDIYVDRSPVFSADRINTPLMLVSGMSDTNVPPGESLQLFTALKLLGRDVAFIAVEDQDHHILDYKKHIHWKSAILSWFDKWLKDEPEWWLDNHGE